MVNVLYVFILLMCCVFNNSQNIGLLNLNYSNYEIDDIKLMDETVCPEPQPCYSPLKYNVKYRCGSDVTCPLGLKCCRGDCFIHKVCVQPYHVNKLQVLELLTSENASLPKTIVFDISNETLLNDVTVNLSENLKNIFANETGEAIFDEPESLISLGAILPFLKNSTYLKETVKEYNQSADEIFEPKPLTKNYETTENSVNANVVNNEIINIDDGIVKSNLITGGLAATTIRTTDAKEGKKSVYSFLYKKAKYRIYKGIKSASLQHIKDTINNIGGFEDDSDYFEGSGDYGTVSTTPDYIKKEFDGSGDYNIQTDELNKYEDKSSTEETELPSSVIAFTETNYLKKEYDGSGDYSQETDEQSKYEEVPRDKEETRTTSSIIVASTSKKVENNGYSKTHHHSPFRNIKSAIIKIKNINRAIKTSKNHFDGFEDDVDYSEGSGTDEGVVGSGNFHKQNENHNISDLVKLVKNNRLFRHAAHYWKQFSSIGDGNEIEGSGSGEGVTLSPQASTSYETSNIASSTDDGSTFLISSSTQQVSEHKQFIGLEDDYYYDLQEDETTTIINQIPFITISSISTTTVSLEDSKIDEDFIDIDDDSSTSSTMSTIQDDHPKTTLEGSGSGDDEIISSGDYDYEGSGAFEESGNVIKYDGKTPSPINVNPTQTAALINVVKEYTMDVIPSVIATSSESGKEYALPEQNHPTINQKEIQKESAVANDVKAALDMMRENTGFKPNATTASSESLEQQVFSETNYENATNSILKSTKINEKEIQKESSVADNILRKYKEDKFETPKHDKAISAAKAALDMMKESTGFEPDDYYEDDS